MSKAHRDILWESTKAVCHSEAIVWENLLRSMHITSVERVFNTGGYLLGYTDASKAQCIDCGKLLSLGSNKPGKQTVHGLKCHLQKCHRDIYTLYTMNVESHQQGPHAKKAKLDEVLTAHCRADLVTECMKKKENTNIIRWLSFSFFWPKIYVQVRFRFVFGRKWNFIFVSIFVYGRKFRLHWCSLAKLIRFSLCIDSMTLT